MGRAVARTKTAQKRKAPATSRRGRAKCKHTGRAVAILGVDVEAYACRECDAVGVRSVGRANDEGNSYVQEEIEAAQIADDPMLAAREDGYFSGYRAGWLAHQGDCDPGDVGISWRAGWLASEMAQVDQTTARHLNHDPLAWPWDPTRPIAGQFGEHLRAALAAAGREMHVPPTDAKEQEHQDMLSLHDDADPLTADGDCDPAGEFPDNLSVAADCQEHPGADSNNDGDCMECLAEIAIDEDAADQAAQDDYDGEYVVVPLCVGEEPEQGVEFEIEPVTCAAPHDGECQPAAWGDGPMVCVIPLRQPASAACLDALEYELTRAAEPDCRDEDGPEVERIMKEMEVGNG